MKKQGKILAVDDNKSILTALDLLLKQYFEKAILVNSPARIHSALQEYDPDVVLLDMNFSSGINNGNEGLFWLSEIKRIRPDVQVVLFTAYGDIDLAVRAIKDGAADFVVKPWENSRLIATLQNAYNLRNQQRQVKHLKEIRKELDDSNRMFWGESRAMADLRNLVEKVAKTDANILITGENGTGKEMLAREIHRLSQRAEELFVSVDLGSLPETLFESELFGHVKGAFTDAKADRAGKFEVADKGTLFLDEIGNISYFLQGKLLTALQSRRITRVGSNTPLDVDIRLISATNRNLPQMVAQGLFREDLLYRINTIHIHIPSLRERKEDILPLARIFTGKYAAKYAKPGLSIGEKAAALLAEYPFPGNIRELQHTMEKAVIMTDKPEIGPESLLLAPISPANISGTVRNATLEDMEREMIKSALETYGGNLSLVAAQLGVSRQTLYNKIKKYGL